VNGLCKVAERKLMNIERTSWLLFCRKESKVILTRLKSTYRSIGSQMHRENIERKR